MDKTLTFNSEELEILTELFSEVAALEYPVSETPEYDALWEKIVSWNNLKIPVITLSEHPMEMKSRSVHTILILHCVTHPQTLN